MACVTSLHCVFWREGLEHTRSRGFVYCVPMGLSRWLGSSLSMLVLLCNCTLTLNFDALSKCSPGRDDCNGEPSDGCESELQADAANCGGCNMPCPHGDGALAACEAGECVQYSLVVGEAHGLDEHPSREEHGGARFGPQFCQESALVGINPAGSAVTLRGLAIACAPVRFAEPPDASVVWGRATVTAKTVGNNGQPDTSYRTLRCEPGMVVTAARYVLGAVAVKEAGLERVYAGITRMSLICSKVSIAPDHHLTLDADGVPSIDFPSAGWPMSTDYFDACPSGEVMVGFDGFGGAVLDALQTACAPLSLQRKAMP
jgi:hypothetical protein